MHLTCNCTRMFILKLLATSLLIAGLAGALLVPTPLTTTAQATTLDKEERAFLELINEYRNDHGAGPLRLTETLTESAEWMSRDMAKKNYFRHTDSKGRNVESRLASFGYRGSSGENIAAGQITAKEVFNAWKNSPGHRRNMLEPTFTTIGISREEDDDGKYKTYWTTDFGDSGSNDHQTRDTRKQKQSPQNSNLDDHNEQSLWQKLLKRYSINF